MQNIKEWYQSEFHEDEFGTQINPEATFEELKNNLTNVYDYLKVYDSIIRERVFVGLADRMNIDYIDIYNKWLKID